MNYFRYIAFDFGSILLYLHVVLMNAHLKPGTFVRLKDQPSDLPDFVLERYLGTSCWIRQQAWGQAVQWKVSASSLVAYSISPS